LESEASVKSGNSVVKRGLAKYRRDLMGMQKVTLDKVGLEPAENFSVFY
jgi:hypothetical protein